MLVLCGWMGRAAGQTQSSLLIEVDEPATLELDGEDLGPFEASKPRKVPVTLGDHVIFATSQNAGHLRLRAQIHVDSANQVSLRISFEDSMAHQEAEEKRVSEKKKSDAKQEKRHEEQVIRCDGKCYEKNQRCIGDPNTTMVECNERYESCKLECP